MLILFYINFVKLNPNLKLLGFFRPSSTSMSNVFAWHNDLLPACVTLPSRNQKGFAAQVGT